VGVKEPSRSSPFGDEADVEYFFGPLIKLDFGRKSVKSLFKMGIFIDFIRLVLFRDIYIFAGLFSLNVIKFPFKK